MSDVLDRLASFLLARGVHLGDFAREQTRRGALSALGLAQALSLAGFPLRDGDAAALAAAFPDERPGAPEGTCLLPALLAALPAGNRAATSPARGAALDPAASPAAKEVRPGRPLGFLILRAY